MSERDLLALAWKEADKISRETMVAVLRSLSNFEPGAVLDIGAGERGYGELFKGRHRRFVTFDIAMQTRPNVIGSALALPFRAGSFETVISTQTLEHLTDPMLALVEMRRMLRAGGHLLLSAPQTWPLHLVPHDYYRFTRFGLELMLARAGFSIERIEPCGGAIATVGQYLALGVFHLGTHARHSRTRHFWRRGVLPLINRISLRLERWRPMTEQSVLNWIVLARPT
ncbi:MAG TPA: class I SAM-dependent methyltransferase [Candidatus Binataceae bacterium]|nr:class I SAM-dependent methyltransferase [Candidatus Binataceae bacterium]